MYNYLIIEFHLGWFVLFFFPSFIVTNNKHASRQWYNVSLKVTPVLCVFGSMFTETLNHTWRRFNQLSVSLSHHTGTFSPEKHENWTAVIFYTTEPTPIWAPCTAFALSGTCQILSTCIRVFISKMTEEGRLWGGSTSQSRTESVVVAIEQPVQDASEDGDVVI